VHGTTNSADFTNGVASNLTPSGTLTFNSGQATQTITVYTYGDTGVGSVEGNENFSIALSGTNAGSSLGATSTYASTITENDTLLTLSADDYSKAEATAGNTTTYTYTMTRTGNTSGASSFTWTASSQTALGYNTYVYDHTQSRLENNVANSSDLQGGFASGTINFGAGETSKTFTVTVNGDDTPEDDEWFSINVTATSGYDEVNVVYDDPGRATGTTLLRQFDTSWRYYDDNTPVSSVTNGLASDKNYLLTSIERDEAVFYLSDREVASTSVQTLNPGDTLYNRAEGDSPADGGTGATVVNIGGTDYGYVEHIFAVQRQGLVPQLEQPMLLGHHHQPVVVLELADRVTQPLTEGAVLVHVDGGANEFMDVAVIARPQLDTLLTPVDDGIQPRLQSLGKRFNVGQLVTPLGRLLNVQ